MRRLGPSTARSALLLLLAGLALVELQAISLVLTAEGDARDRSVKDIAESWPQARLEIEAAFRVAGLPGGLAEARRQLGSLAEVDLIDPEGASSGPAANDAPDAPPPPASLRDLDPVRFVVVGPSRGPVPRVFVFGAIRVSRGFVYLRLAREARELAAGHAERRLALFANGLGLLLVLLAVPLAAHVMRPESRSPLARDAGLDVLETAIERLKVHDQAVTRAHQEELQHLRETIKDREAMARAGELTSGIVHEVRNGLGTLAGYVRLLERSAGTSAEAAEIIRSIRDECATLEGVIRRIVEFVRTEELRPAEFDLKRLLERVVAREGRSRPGAEAQVLLAEPLLLVGDEDLLERAFENLVRNARDAAGPAGHVTVEAARDGEVVAVRVTDDGPGLAPEVQGRLRPFATTKAGGLGLGLPMALKILTLHGGSLDLVPRQPRGLTAVAQIPPCRDTAGATEGSAGSPSGAPSPEP